VGAANYFEREQMMQINAHAFDDNLEEEEQEGDDEE